MIAAITCFYNPANSNQRLENYRFFRQMIRKENDLPLYVIELAFGEDPFQLGPGDADHLVQLRTSELDLMWQKERLLNILIEDLPQDVDKVIWIDCDIVFLEDGWSHRASEALNTSAIIQPYAWAICLPQCEGSLIPPSHWILCNCSGSASIRKSFALYCSCRSRQLNFNGGHVGYVWAAKRELLDYCGLYDSIITGAGDLFIGVAAFGLLNLFEEIPDISINDAAVEHYFEWGYKFRKCVQEMGGTGYTQELLAHVWHGDVMNRNYLLYSQCLGMCDFDPQEDLMLGSDRLYHWKRKNNRLHNSVVSIFKNIHLNVDRKSFTNTRAIMQL